MARQNVELLAFNRGLISPMGIARVDLDRVKLMAEHSVNWMPRTLGPMSLRPGLGYLGRTGSDAYARCLPFVFATDDVALLELTPLPAMNREACTPPLESCRAVIRLFVVLSFRSIRASEPPETGAAGTRNVARIVPVPSGKSEAKGHVRTSFPRTAAAGSDVARLALEAETPASPHPQNASIVRLAPV